MTFTLTCMAAELARAVSLASQVSGNSKQLNILKSCMIDVAGGSAVIAATDMDHAVRVTLAAEGTGRVFVDTAMLAQKTAALRPSVPVIISGDDPNFVMMVQGKTKWKIPLVSEAEHKQFPFEITQPIDGDEVEIGAAMFIAATQSAKTIVREGVASPINMGVYLDMTDGFRAVGADSRGLAVVQVDNEPLAASVILPNNAISVIGNMFRSAEILSIVATPDGMSVSADGVMYRTKLVEQAYPDWRKAHVAQTKGVNGSVIVDAADISEVVRRATAIAEEKGKDGSSLAVRLTFSDGECAATAKNRNGEEGTDYCPADGDSGTAMVNANVILDAIGSFGSERLKIGINTKDEGAIQIEPYPETPMQNERIVMPRRI